jgi:hypothetical protein
MTEYERMMNEYKESYDLGKATPNDIQNLSILVNNRIIIDTLSRAITEQVGTGDILSNSTNIKKLQDSMRDIIDQNLAVERALGIDRKSRRKENQQDVAGYMQIIKSAAADWLDKNLIKVYCDTCKIMVGRILPVHEHTEFDIRFQCSQCSEFVVVKRKEKSIFFDVKGRKDWREKHPIEIIHPTKVVEFEDDIELSNGDLNA